MNRATKTVTTQQVGPEKISLMALANQAKSSGERPIERWNPPFCGAIDMEIVRDGRWLYQGTPIRRPALAALFASILRREDDGHHYLVTPVEKVRISVEDAPFFAAELFLEGHGGTRLLGFRTTLGRVVVAGPEHPLRFAIEPGSGGLKPYINVAPGRGLEALVSRSLVYDLADLIEERSVEGRIVAGLASNGAFFPLPEGGA